MAIFNVDFNKLVKMLLPTFSRKARMVVWLKCLIAPIIWLYNKFIAARRYDLFREGIDCTIPRLEFMLNTIFYPAGLTTAYNYRIVIDKVVRRNALSLFLGGITQATDEGRPRNLYTAAENQPLYTYTAAETWQATTSFIIKVPVGVEYDEARMRAEVRAYCLPDKDFIIITY